jgi:hypothetical protein
MSRTRHGQDADAASRGGRRVPPPEATGLEARYLASLQATGSPVRIHLCDGTSIEGVVGDHDRELLAVRSATCGGREIAVRKREIRYLEELGR